MTDADKKLLELSEKATPRPWLQEKHTIYTLEHHGWNKGEEIFHNRFTATVHCRANADERLATIAYIVAAANAVPRLVAEKDALLARIERLRNVMSNQTIEFAEPSAKTEAIRKTWAMNVLAADAAAAKESSDD